MIELIKSSFDAIKDDFLEPLNRPYFSNNFELKYSNCKVCEFFKVADEGKKIGGIILHDFDKFSNRIMFTIAISTKLQNVGFGYEVMKRLLKYLFRERKIRKVFLEVYDTNRRAIKLYQKLGFRKEGVLKEHTYKEGKYIDLIIMAMLKREYENNFGEDGGVK